MDFSPITKSVKSVKNTFSVFKRATSIFAVIALALMGFYFLTGNKLTTESATNQNLPCALTADQYLVNPDFTDLKTEFGISLIGKDLFNTKIGKNTIKPINNPTFESIEYMKQCIDNNEVVFVVNYNETVKIYPSSILVYHSVVNDDFKGEPVLITYSGLSDLFSAYLREYKNEILSYGDSGYLYKNNNLLYDTKTDSLWSQFDGKALVGNLTGAQLTEISYEQTSFQSAVAKYPHASVLSYDTGYHEDYLLNPYLDYSENSTIVGPVNNITALLPEKTDVIVFTINDHYYAIPTTELDKGVLIKKIDSKFLEITKKGNLVSATYDSQPLKIKTLYWFVWYDFHPETTLLGS